MHGRRLMREDYLDRESIVGSAPLYSRSDYSKRHLLVVAFGVWRYTSKSAWTCCQSQVENDFGANHWSTCWPISNLYILIAHCWPEKRRTPADRMLKFCKLDQGLRTGSRQVMRIALRRDHSTNCVEQLVNSNSLSTGKGGKRVLRMLTLIIAYQLSLISTEFRTL